MCQLLVDRLQGLLRRGVVFQGVEHQRPQFLGNGGFAHGARQRLHLGGKVQAALPAGGLLAQAELAAQRGQFVAHQVHDLAATQVVAGVFRLCLALGREASGSRFPFSLAQGVHEIQRLGGRRSFGRRSGAGGHGHLVDQRDGDRRHHAQGQGGVRGFGGR